MVAKLGCSAKQYLFVHAVPMPMLAEALFLALLSRLGSYSLDAGSMQLQRSPFGNRDAPDSTALACGTASLLRQYHDAHTQACLAHLQKCALTACKSAPVTWIKLSRRTDGPRVASNGAQAAPGFEGGQAHTLHVPERLCVFA